MLHRQQLACLLAPWFGSSSYAELPGAMWQGRTAFEDISLTARLLLILGRSIETQRKRMNMGQCLTLLATSHFACNEARRCQGSSPFQKTERHDHWICATPYRLSFPTGDGPDEGWISITLNHKVASICSNGPRKMRLNAGSTKVLAEHCSLDDPWHKKKMCSACYIMLEVMMTGKNGSLDRPHILPARGGLGREPERDVSPQLGLPLGGTSAEAHDCSKSLAGLCLLLCRCALIQGNTRHVKSAFCEADDVELFHALWSELDVSGKYKPPGGGSAKLARSWLGQAKHARRRRMKSSRHGLR